MLWETLMIERKEIIIATSKQLLLVNNIFSFCTMFSIDLFPGAAKIFCKGFTLKPMTKYMTKPKCSNIFEEDYVRCVLKDDICS